MNYLRYAVLMIFAVATAACSYPNEVSTVATLTNGRVIALQSEASTQAASFKKARSEAKARAERLHALNLLLAEINHLPQADMKDAALSSAVEKAKLARFDALRSGDAALRADAYSLLQAHKLTFSPPKAQKLDLAGLAEVIKQVEPMSKGERLTVVDILTYAIAVNQELAALDAERSGLAGAENIAN